MFSHLVGNQAVKEQLTNLISHDRLPHTLLFCGPSGVGKMLFAKALATKLLASTKAQHPDLHLYEPTGKSGLHTMETIREMLEEVALPPFEAPAKIFLIDEAERMLPASSNALLKTLEEPPLDSYFILITSEPDKLLPTLLSRCASVRFFPVPQAEIISYLQKRFTLNDEQAQKIALRSEGSIAKACALAERGDDGLATLVEKMFKERAVPDVADEQVDAFFREIALFFRKQPERLNEVLPLIEEGRLALERHMKLSAVLQFLLLNLK